MSKGKNRGNKGLPAGAPSAPKKLNATQTLEALTNGFSAQNQQMQILADEIDRLRQMITALNKRVNASIQAAEEGGLTGASVNKIIVDGNMKELEGKVQFLVEQGVLKKNDLAEISAQTFVVGREVDTDGNVVNPRVQFAVGSVDKTLQDQLLSKKTGDMIKYNDTDPSLEIVEIYEIHQPEIKKNLETQAPA